MPGLVSSCFGQFETAPVLGAVSGQRAGSTGAFPARQVQFALRLAF